MQVRFVVDNVTRVQSYIQIANSARAIKFSFVSTFCDAFSSAICCK